VGRDHRHVRLTFLGGGAASQSLIYAVIAPQGTLASNRKNKVAINDKTAMSNWLATLLHACSFAESTRICGIDCVYRHWAC
jgi:hypothetical protein